MKNEFSKIELNVKLTPEEVISKISSIMEKEPLFWHFIYHGDKKLIGKIKGQKFQIRKKADCWHSWNQILFGRVELMPNGSRIKVCLRMHLFSMIIMILYFAGVSSSIIFGGLSFLTKPTEDSKSIFFTALIMLVFGIVVAFFGKRFGKRNGKEVISALSGLFSDVLL
jgi:cellulose synthase/poly-beta-1,6-N-acetylglucosamine synthase-like glycosyltransferase